MRAHTVGMLPGSSLGHADHDDGGRLVFRAEGGRVGLFEAGVSVRAGHGVRQSQGDRSGLQARIGTESRSGHHGGDARRDGHMSGQRARGCASASAMLQIEPRAPASSSSGGWCGLASSMADSGTVVPGPIHWSQYDRKRLLGISTRAGSFEPCRLAQTSGSVRSREDARGHAPPPPHAAPLTGLGAVSVPLPGQRS